MVIIDLTPDSDDATRSETLQADIVAVHGLFEDELETWTHPRTRQLWLRDLFPHRRLRTRVFAYAYRSDILTSPGQGNSDSLLAHATNLVAELCAERQLTETSENPIIFVCHGFGGLLVKRALVYSCSKSGKGVEHLRSIFDSTFGIIFFGTPHNGIEKETLLLPRYGHTPSPSQFMLNLLKGSEMIQEIQDQFVPLSKRFSIYNIWEQLESTIGGGQAHIVDESSAAPPWDNVERCGLMSDHSGMVNFKSPADPGYRVILEALTRYIRLSPSLIRSRWENARKSIEIERQREVDDLLQPRLQQLPAHNTASANKNEWFVVPHASTNYFTGRAMQARVVKEKFRPISTGFTAEKYRIFVIHGLGGSGKTQFCLRYAEQNRSYYWGVFWIDASNEEVGESGFAALGEAAGKGSSFTAGMHWLSTSSKPWLLIIDNADDPDMDISRFLPAGSIGHILITTRNPAAISYSTTGSFRFHGMDPEEAATLLLKAAYPDTVSERPESQNHRLAEAISSELGYLALALAHAGATIRRNIYTLEKYLHYYLGYRKRILSYPKVKSADDANIVTTWEIPFRKIVDRGSISVEHKDAVDLVHIFAFLHFECIPERLFRISQHEMDKNDLASFPDILLVQSTWIWIRRIGLLFTTLERATEIERFASVYAENGMWKQACALQRSVVEFRMKHLGRRHESVLQAKRSLALSHWNLFDVRAAGEIQFQILKTRWWSRPSVAAWMIWPPWKPDYILYYQTLDDLTLTLWLAGKRDKSKYTGERAVQGLTKHLGPTDPRSLNAMFNLARTYIHIGEQERAQQLLGYVIKVRKLFFGMNHPDTLMARNELGMSLCSRKQHMAVAETLVTNVLKVRKRILGEEHAYTLWSVNDLSKVLCGRGRAQEAVVMLEEIVPVVTRTLGDSHVGMLMTRSNLARAYFLSGRWSDAEETLRKLLPLIPPDHPDSIHNMCGYVHVLIELGDFEQAENKCVKLLDTITTSRVLTLDHPGTATVAQQLAHIYRARGKSHEEASLIRRLPIAGMPYTIKHLDI
ncbi:MAG: hypothetical protein M1822_002432 [Bathelium mastoideum]|nr:MAG: hypothetical protein M1822_002432 [Bathelium mastoideum]